MFRIWLSTAVAGVALAAVGAAQADRGVRPAEPAGKYMAGIVEQKITNQYDLAWQSLYPPHQRVASLTPTSPARASRRRRERRCSGSRCSAPLTSGFASRACSAS